MPTHAPPPIVSRALSAALELANTRKWQSITLIEIAAAATLPMSELHGLADKDTLTDALEGWADEAMSAEAIDLDETVRERLFDVIMRRFEQMETQRAGVLSLMQARDRSPARLAALLQARRTSAGWALSCAGLDNGNNAQRTARVLGIAWAIGKTERAWRKDESGDFARTMATLDAELSLIEERLSRFARFSSQPSGEASSAKQEDASPHASPQAETDQG